MRYLEIGPVTGQPVIILRPMVFPYIDDKDVALFDTLGWRILWPIRAGCLSHERTVSRDWTLHCARAAAEIQVVRKVARIPLAIPQAYRVRKRLCLKHALRRT